ncbi:MAG: TolC family protein [Muribaculaceae bacterium]|nr:TolC family protein [Muribaculaceae bacterium]
MTLNKIITIIATCISIGLPANALTTEQIIDKVVNGALIKVYKNQNLAEHYANRSQNWLPGPEIDFDHLWSHDGMTKWSLSVTQNFDWPGLYSARKKVNDAKNLSNDLRLLSTINELKLQAFQLTISIAYDQKRIDFVQNMLDDYTQLHEQMKEALEAGNVTILDETKVEIELIQLRIQLTDYVNNLNEDIAKLTELAGGELDFAEEKFELPVLPALHQREYYIAQLEEDPTLLAMEATRNAALLEIEQSKMANLPSFGIGYRHEKEENDHFNGFGISISLPTYGLKTYRQAAQFNLETAEISSLLSKRVSMARIDNEYKAATILRDNIGQHQAEGVVNRYWNFLKDALEGGELSLLDYIREKSYYINIFLSITDIEEKYALLNASLNRFEL